MLKGKTAIITGSTSGIGKGIAEALAKEQCNLLVNGFASPQEVESLLQYLQKTYAIKADYSSADLSKPDEVSSMVEQGIRTFGTVDILVNNAGIQHVDAIEDFPDEKWDAVIAINLSAVFHGIKAVMPYMKKQHSGRIINIASAHGLVASAKKSAYVAAKHGVVGLTKVVALETAEMGITCNAVCPGWVLTPLVQKQIDAIAARKGISEADAKIELLSEKQPSKSFVTVDQLGGLCVFLCSDAAQNMTGASLSMDGGWTAQ